MTGILKVNQIEPTTGTTITLGASGDTIAIPSGATFTNSGTTSTITISGALSVDGGTIKLDGNYPTGTDNVAMGNTALDSIQSGGTCNITICIFYNCFCCR